MIISTLFAYMCCVGLVRFIWSLKQKFFFGLSFHYSGSFFFSRWRNDPYPFKNFIVSSCTTWRPHFPLWWHFFFMRFVACCWRRRRRQITMGIARSNTCHGMTHWYLRNPMPNKGWKLYNPSVLLCLSCLKSQTF